jgi:hypothetical protein
VLGLGGKIVPNRLKDFYVEELDNLYSLSCIVSVIRSRRMRCAADVCTRQVRIDCYYLARLWPSTNSFEHGNELQGCIKSSEYLD